MIDLEISQVREYNKIMFPAANIDAALTFYYDETNNIKKFHVREGDFNTAFTANFILGGIVHSGDAPDLQPLIDGLKLQKNAKEVKFKHIAHGEFLDCLKSEKLTFFLQYIYESDLYVHYSTLNILYWSLVDIVDSAILHSESAKMAGPDLAHHMKNDLYKLARLEIDTITELFYKYEYPNVKQENINAFIDELNSLFENYIETEEFHFGLESLRQLLEQAKKNGSLAFVMDEEDHVLINNLSQFYLRPIYTFKNSQHILDKEDFIARMLQDYRILNDEEEIQNYSFEDSQSNRLIQCSDVFIGLIGKFSTYTNTTAFVKIVEDLGSLMAIQQTNLHLLINVINKSLEENIGFVHSTDCYEEMSKLSMIRDFIEEYWA